MQAPESTYNLQAITHDTHVVTTVNHNTNIIIRLFDFKPQQFPQQKYTKKKV